MHSRRRFFYYQKKQSHKLQDRFSPEYDRTVIRPSNEGQSELKAREKRVERLEISLWRRRKPPEVTDMRGLVEKYKVKEFQVTLKLGFRLEEQPA